MAAPEAMSPYWAEAIPRITSTDSMLLVVMVRMSTPELGVDMLGPASAPNASDRVCMLALFERGAPSMMMAVPKLWPLRTENVLTFLRAISSAVRVLAPGRSDMMSASDVA